MKDGMIVRSSGPLEEVFPCLNLYLFSLFCFLRYGNSLERRLWCSILNGGDRDTMCAMACAISGAYVGINNIRDEWKIKLENYSRIQELMMRALYNPQCKKGLCKALSYLF